MLRGRQVAPGLSVDFCQTPPPKRIGHYCLVALRNEVSMVSEALVGREAHGGRFAIAQVMPERLRVGVLQSSRSEFVTKMSGEVHGCSRRGGLGFGSTAGNYSEQKENSRLAAPLALRVTGEVGAEAGSEGVVQCAPWSGNHEMAKCSRGSLVRSVGFEFKRIL